MKRIVFLGAGLSSGGAEHQCTILMNLLIKRGYDVTYSSFGEVEDHYFVSSKVKRIYLAMYKPTWYKVLRVFFYLLFVRCDVLFAFSQRMSVLSLFPMIFRPSIKVISSERNYTIGKSDIFEKILVKTRIYNRANYVVPNNYSQADYLKVIMPSLRKKIRVITNYTDIDEYKFTSLPNNEPPKIAVFCRIESQKNFHNFIKAISIVRANNPNLEFQIDWYGNHVFDNPVQIEYYEIGKELIIKSGLSNYISIYDPIKNVAEVLPQYDGLCLPSLYEGFSNSISEYICCGRPVLCSDVSDNHIMVQNDVNGYLFNPLNIEDIANVFVKFLTLPLEKKEMMAAESRKIAESLFNKELFLGKYVDLIENFQNNEP